MHKRQNDADIGEQPPQKKQKFNHMLKCTDYFAKTVCHLPLNYNPDSDYNTNLDETDYYAQPDGDEISQETRVLDTDYLTESTTEICKYDDYPAISTSVYDENMPRTSSIYDPFAIMDEIGDMAMNGEFDEDYWQYLKKDFTNYNYISSPSITPPATPKPEEIVSPPEIEFTKYIVVEPPSEIDTLIENITELNI